MATGYIDGDETVTIEILGSDPDEARAPQLLSRAVHCALQKTSRTPDLRWLAGHPDMPEEILLRLADHEELREDLGHRDGPPALLERLAELGQREARLTLGLKYYQDESVDVNTFADFLERHGADTWLLETLALRDTPTAEKEKTLSRYASQSPYSDRLVTLRLSRQRENQARTESDPQKLRELLETNDPKVMRQLALNPQTPLDVLRKLIETREVKYAAEIRTAARFNLAGRGGSPEGETGAR